ncbi:DMT family transporter [Nonomuraea pusilla]|uniref:Drug/metabolite transporter, DME family n=1 Tax=Nonomuraea pusilla TaxID=46177 RepID=A0A1H8AFF2_9ACTN|nr:EamA family transporter [Nonomuraea pusilla]SEM68664.1 drug/metabolite transporter, DME family [Nonomuraea pusilla]
MTHVSARRGAAYASAAALAWGTGGAAGSLLFQTGGLGPVGVSFWRYLLGAAFLLGVAACAAQRSPGGPFARPVALVAGAGRPRVLVAGVGMAVYQTAYFAGIAHAGVAVATVVTMGATPLFTALGGRLLLGERVGGTGLVSLAAALAGLALLSGVPGSGAAGPGPAGIGFSLLSAAGYAAVTLHSRRHRDDPQGMAVGGFLVGAACLAPFALADGVLPGTGPSSPAPGSGMASLVPGSGTSWFVPGSGTSWFVPGSGTSWFVPGSGTVSVALLVYLGAVPTALAYALFFRALTALRATTVAVISLGEAVGAALLGVALFGERLTAAAWCGCALLLAAVAVPAIKAE